MHCTIVFVSHDLEEAVKLGNTITIMEGGRIVQTGRARGHRAPAGERLCRRLRRAPEPAERADRGRRDGRRRRARRSGADRSRPTRRCGRAAVLRGVDASGLGAAGRRDGRAGSPARGLCAARARERGRGRRSATGRAAPAQAAGEAHAASRTEARCRAGRWSRTLAAISSGTRPARTHSRYPAAIPASCGQRDARSTCRQLLKAALPPAASFRRRQRGCCGAAGLPRRSRGPSDGGNRTGADR